MRSPKKLHPIVKEFLEFRKTIKKSPKRSPRRKSFCGNTKNKGSRRMGSPHECLKRGYGSSNHSFINDLDLFFRRAQGPLKRSR